MSYRNLFLLNPLNYKIRLSSTRITETFNINNVKIVLSSFVLSLELNYLLCGLAKLTILDNYLDTHFISISVVTR